MAMLVRTQCDTCGLRVMPRSKSNTKEYVHVDPESASAFYPLRYFPEDRHPVVVKMVTLKERY